MFDFHFYFTNGKIDYIGKHLENDKYLMVYDSMLNFFRQWFSKIYQSWF